MLVSPNIHIDEKWKGFQVTEIEKATIVHCTYFSSQPIKLRVWKNSTFLFEENGSRRKLMNFFNINILLWTYFYPTNGSFKFTLLFESLSKDCKEFKLVEDLGPLRTLYNRDVKGALCTDWIQRNDTDVYHVVVKPASA